MKGVTFALGAGALYGASGVLIKMAMTGTTAMDLAFFRIGIAALVALLILLAIERGKSFNVSKKEIKTLGILGVFTMMGFGLYVISLKYTTVANAIILIYTSPILTAIFAKYFLKEKLTKYTAIAVTLAIAGMVIILYNGLIASSLTNIGNLIALGAAVGFAVRSVLIRYDERFYAPDQVLFWPLAVAALLFIPLAFFEGGGIAITNTEIIYPLLALGIVTALGMFSINHALKYIEAHIGSVVTMVTEVLTTIILAFLILSEGLTLNTIAGGSLILLAGIMIHKELKPAQNLGNTQKPL